MVSRSRGRPPNAHSDRFRNALWAWRIYRGLKLSWADLDNLYLIAKGVPPRKYVRANYDVINVMESIYSEGRNPAAYKRKREKRPAGTTRAAPTASVNLVNEFVGWVNEGEALNSVKAAQLEFQHPIWKFLAGKRLPAFNDWMIPVHRILAERGLLKFRGVSLTLAREVAGKSFPAHEGDLQAIARGAHLIATEPSLDTLLVLAFEYRSALDRFQPAEAQHYLDAFLIASRAFSDHIGDAYLANGISMLIAQRLFRNEWGVIGPERWRRGEQRKDPPAGPTEDAAEHDALADMLKRGPSNLLPLDDLIVPGTPILAPDDKMKWFVTHFEACFTTLYLERTGGPGPKGIVRSREGGDRLLEKARTLWGAYEPVDQGLRYGWDDQEKSPTMKKGGRGRGNRGRTPS